MTRLKLTRTLRLAVAILLVGSVAVAAEVNDDTFGFKLTIPEGFTPVAAGAAQPDTLHSFTRREAGPEAPAHIIQLQRLHGTISPTQRLTPEDFPEVEGIKTTLQEFTWKGHTLDVMRQTMALANGAEYVVFGIQYPLSGEAVQLQVGGLVQDEKKIHALFTQLAGAFQNTKPLHSKVRE